MLARPESIRDIIAFPKPGGDFDPLTETSAPITPLWRKEVGVNTTSKKRSEEAEAME